MKTLLMIAIAMAFSNQVMASDNACTIKQKNAASFALAQREAAPVQKVFVAGMQPGLWTEMPGLNSGSDEFTLTLETPSGTLFQVYEVAANQIGSTADCDIISVKPVTK